jgi:hypothetical protein
MGLNLNASKIQEGGVKAMPGSIPEPKSGTFEK